MDSEYDQWNSVKKKIAFSNHKPPHFKESDIWWISIGYNIGNEIYGKGINFVRPILVIKKFNRNFFLGVPLSTKIKKNPYYINITVKEKDISALISQVRTFSSKRMSNKLGELDSKDYNKVLESIQGLLKKLPPSITKGGRG
jgi:mRNA interferase MazF